MAQRPSDPWAEIDRLVTGQSPTATASKPDVWADVDKALTEDPRKPRAASPDVAAAMKARRVADGLEAGPEDLAPPVRPVAKPAPVQATLPTIDIGPAATMAKVPYTPTPAQPTTPGTPVTPRIDPETHRIDTAIPAGMSVPTVGPLDTLHTAFGTASGAFNAAPTALGERLAHQSLPGHEQEPDTFLGRLASHAKMILSGQGGNVASIGPVGAMTNPADTYNPPTTVTNAPEAYGGVTRPGHVPGRPEQVAEETARRGMDMLAQMATDPTAVAAMGIGGAPGELLAAAFTVDGVATAARVARDPKATPEDVATAMLGVAIQSLPMAVRMARPPVEAAVRGFKKGYAEGAARRATMEAEAHQGFENAKPVAGPRAGEVAPDQALVPQGGATPPPPADVWAAVDQVVQEPRSDQGPTPPPSVERAPVPPVAVRPGTTTGESVGPVAPSPEPSPVVPTVASSSRDAGRTGTTADLYRAYRQATRAAGQKPLMFHQWDDTGRPTGQPEPQEQAPPVPAPEFAPVGTEAPPAPPTTPVTAPPTDTGSIVDRINGKLANGEKLGTKEAREADELRRRGEAAREAVAEPETPAAPDHEETWKTVDKVLEPPREFSSTQVELPQHEAEAVKQVAAKIPDADLANDGREAQPHVTVKFGLHTNDDQDVARALSGEGPITVRLGKTSVFPAKEGAPYDVVKVDVDSPDLHRLNQKIADALPHTDTHPTYKPHVTLAYVKPGLGEKYAGMTDLEGHTLTVNAVTFSGKDRQEIPIALSGSSDAAPGEANAVASAQPHSFVARDGGGNGATRQFSDSLEASVWDALHSTEGATARIAKARKLPDDKFAQFVQQEIGISGHGGSGYSYEVTKADGAMRVTGPTGTVTYPLSTVAKTARRLLDTNRPEKKSTTPATPVKAGPDANADTSPKPIVEFTSGPNKGKQFRVTEQSGSNIRGHFVDGGGWISTDIRNVRPVSSEAPAAPSTPVTPKTSGAINRDERWRAVRLKAHQLRTDISKLDTLEQAEQHVAAAEDMATKADGTVFKVGDRVRYTDGDPETYIVKGIHPNGIRVEHEAEPGVGKAVSPVNIERVPAAATKPTTPVTRKAEAPAKTPVTTPEEKYDAARRGVPYEEMTEGELRELLDIGVKDEPQKAAAELKRRQTPTEGEAGGLATKLYAVFASNPDRIPKDPRELRKMAAQLTGQSEQAVADHIDELNDAVEAALAHQITPSTPRANARLHGLTKAVEEAQRVEAMLPRAHRTLEKTKLQQFSTPLPISVIAAHAAGIMPQDVVLEPTAGTGNLIAAVAPRQGGGPQTFAMELAPRRVALLKAQGYHVTDGDYLATKPPQEPTVIVTNPPWGKYSTGKYGRGVALGFPPSDVAERFVAKNMRDLAEGGRLVAVMPTTMIEAPNFKAWLRHNFAVRAIIKSPPGSYDTRATSVDSVLLVVDKVKGDGQLPKVVAVPDWQAYIREVEAIHERSPIRAAEGRTSVHARPAAGGRPERVSGSPRTGGAEPRRDTPVGTGRPADVVAEAPASGGRGSVEFAGAADGPAPEPAGAPAVTVSGPTAQQRREAADSRFFAPYARRATFAGQPHPKLLVEAKQLAGVPYPALTIKPTPSMTKAIAAGRVSVEQAEQALAVLQANSGPKPHGYLAADAVGVGKSREIAMSLLGAMDRARAEKRPLRLMLTTKSRDNVEDLLDEIHYVASGQPASQGGTVPFEVFRLADDYPGAKKTGNAYEPLPKPTHAVYVVDSYNVAPFRQALVDVNLHGVVGDEVQRFTNQDAQIGGAWQNLHARIMRDTPRPEQFFAYFTATPAQKVEDYRYLYGLRLWPIDGFPDWLELVTGALDEKKAKELEEATERGSVKPLDDLIKQTAPDVVGVDSEDGGENNRPRGRSWQTQLSNVFAQRLTPAEGEQIPREWKILGRFSARDLWRKGTTFEIHNFDLTKDQTARYNQFVDLSRDIMESAYKYGLYDKSGKASRFGVSGALQFAAKRIQMQPALEEAVRLAKKLAGEGYQPVLSIINVSEMSDQGGHLTAAINKINTRMVDTDPNDPDGGLADLGEIPEAVVDRARLMDRVRDLGSFSDPVEYIADELGKDKVAFIIGKEKAGRRKASGEFQSGKRTYAVISGAGSTGINLDQRTRTAQAPGHGRRVFLDVQYEWSAMEAVQRYGRVDRASSITPPRIIALTSGNASEKKFLATIANRMAALGALSKGGAEATGAAGNALEEFEITGDDALEAARKAYEESSDDTKRSFAIVKSAFRNPNRNGSNPDRADFDPFSPSRDAHGVSMSDFQLPLLLMPMEQANDFWERFIKYRDQIRAESGERNAMRSARFSGDVLEKHALKPNLDLYAVKNEQGKKFGILTGLITPEMPKLREVLRGAKHEEGDEQEAWSHSANVGVKRRYVTFTHGDDIITGLQVPWTRIPTIADAYGKAVSGPKLDTPDAVLAYLKAGETIRLSVTNPDSGKPWILRYRPSDQRIAIDNARMQDRTQLLQHGGDYVPVGNYWRVKDLDKFLDRWPVPEQVGAAKPKVSASSSGGGPTLQAAVIPGLKEFVEQDVTPGLKAAAENLSAAKSDVRALFAPDTVGTPAVTFAGTMRANLAAHSQRVQRAQKVLRQMEKAFDKLPNDTNVGFIDAIEEGAIDSLPPNMQKAAETLRSLLDTKRREVQKRGRLQQYIQNYFPHEWAEPGAVKKLLTRILGRRPLQGSKNFLKQRKIPTVREGLALGLEPVSYNPVTLVLRKLVEMDKWIMATDILRDAKRTGVAKFVRVGGEVPDGWVKYHESFGTVYGPPTVPVKEAYDKPLMDALFEWSQKLGITSVRKVNVGGRRWGYAVTPGDTVVTKVGGPEGVLMHEIGHILDERYGLRSKWVNNPEMRKELRDLADVRLEGGGDHSAYYKRYVRKGEEKIANLVHGFIYMPERTKKIAPRAYWALYNLAKETPALKPILTLQKTRSTALGVNVAQQSVGGLVIKGHYYGPPEATRLLNNYLSPGLRGNAAFNAYRVLGNFMNQVQLGLSAFHLTMTGLEAVVSKASQALQETERAAGLALRGEGKRSVVELLNAGRHAAETPVATFLDLYRGHQALKEFYRRDANAKTIATITDTIIQAGGGVGWDRLHHDAMPEAFMRALRQGNVIGAAWRAIPAVFELTAKPIMEWWVPRLKLGAYLDLARMELRTLGDEPSIDEVRRVLAKSWDSIDNRFGELRYDNLFWHNALKDMGMASVRALGWNVGTVREVFGAPTQQVGRLLKGTTDVRMRHTGYEVDPVTGEQGDRIFEPEPEPWLTNKAAYVVAMVTLYGLLGALYQLAHTGQAPEELRDYFFPKTGHKKPDGSDERVSIPGYFKDAYAALHDLPGSALTTAGHKLHPLLNVLYDMLRNEDYYGTEIHNTDDPKVEQVKQLFAYLAQSFMPISVRNFERRRESLTGSRINGPESWLGITEAPASVSRSAAEKMIRDYTPEFHRTLDQAHAADLRRQIRDGLRARTPEGLSAARDAVNSGTLTSRQVQNAIRSVNTNALEAGFKRLTLAQALNVYRVATERERAQLWPLLEAKVNLLPNAAPNDQAMLVRRFKEAMRLPRAGAGRTPITAR